MSNKPNCPNLSDLGVGLESLQQVNLSQVISGSNWRPIETAPRDGSFILARNLTGHHGDCRWFSYEEGKKGAWVWPSYFAEPTHWMPLPGGPEEA